jgi:cysteine desulfuration protein SufE
MTANELPTALADAIAELQTATDARQRMLLILQRGKSLPPLPAENKTDASSVPGCTSRVYLIGSCENGQMVYQGDADALLIKGLVAILIDALSGESPQRICAIPTEALQQDNLGLQQLPGRNNGFQNIFAKLQELAQTHL